MGAVEAGTLDEEYVATPYWAPIRRRAGWLLVLFLSEMLTATAMGRFEEEIARRGPRAVRTSDHQQRRQLGLAGCASRPGR